MELFNKEKIYFSIFRFSAFLGVAVLLLVLVLLFFSGKEALSWKFLSSNWQHRNISQGGIFPAIIGSLYLGLGVVLVSFPLGIATAIFLNEYNRNNWVRKVIHLAIRNLAGVPSVVYGLFGLAVFVHFLSFGTSLLSAVLTLSAMTLPWIITTSLEALRAVPDSFRESSFALGATRWQTISKVVFPSAFSSSITGGIIAVARAMGETAPIILVGATFYLSTLPSSPLDKFMALPYHTFILATQHSSPYATSFAAGTALVLVVLTFLLILGAIVTRYYFRRKKDW